MSSLFPGALDTTASLFTAVNSKTTPLTGFHNSTITTITLGDTTGAPANGYALIDGEAILYTAKTATTLTGCTRHADGTAAASHNDKATVKFGLVADHHNSLVQAVMALETKVGAGVSGIDGAQMKANSIPASKLQGGAALGYRVRVYHTGALATPAGANTRIPMNNLSGVDPQAMFDAVNTRLVCTKDGTYLISGCVTFNNANPGTVVTLVSAIFKNGLEVSRGTQLSNTTQFATPSLPVVDQVPLVAGDYIDLYAELGGGPASSLWLGSTGQFQYLAMALLP